MLSILLSFAVVVPQSTSAQPVSAPLIQNVTVNADTSIITITGSGVGPDVLVTVDGQAVTVLPGATVTRIEVAAPATIFGTPGTYRLTVVDPVRQVGDVFVVTSQAARVGIAGAKFLRRARSRRWAEAPRAQQSHRPRQHRRPGTGFRPW